MHKSASIPTNRFDGIPLLMPSVVPPAKSRQSRCSFPNGDALAEPLLKRDIGVIYRPETELLSHYSRPNWRGNSMPGSGLPRPRPWWRTARSIRTVPTRPTPLESKLCAGYVRTWHEWDVRVRPS